MYNVRYFKLNTARKQELLAIYMYTFNALKHRNFGINKVICYVNESVQSAYCLHKHFVFFTMALFIFHWLRTQWPKPERNSLLPCVHKSLQAHRYYIFFFSKLRFYGSYLEKPYIAYNVDLLPKEILAFSTFRNFVVLFVTLYQCLLLPNFLEVVK